MTKKSMTTVAVVIGIGIMSFLAGFQLQKAQYKDVCLDLGGGQNPGQYPICVIEQQNTELWLGPIRVTPNDVVEFELQQGANGQPQVRLELSPEIASPLIAFTEESVGKILDVRIGGQLVNSVHIAEALQGPSVILALTEAQAKKLEVLFTRNTN